MLAELIAIILLFGNITAVRVAELFAFFLHFVAVCIIKVRSFLCDNGRPIYDFFVPRLITIYIHC